MSALTAKPFSAAKVRAGQSSRRVACRVVCSSQLQTSRRELLAAGAALSVATALIKPNQAAAIETEAVSIDVKNLSTFQRQDQRIEYTQKAFAALNEVLSAEDAPACVRLVFNDAGTYDEATRTGGMDGSIVLSDELNRAENAALKSVVEKLKAAKAKIDEGGAKTGAGPISWADLLVLAGKAATIKAWNVEKAKKMADPAQVGIIPPVPWPVQLGRIDSAEAAPSGRIPSADASVQEIKSYLLSLGAKPESGFLTAKPPFWERPGFLIWSAAAVDPAATEEKLAAGDSVFAQYKKKYDASRKTLTRTDFEVDFVSVYTKVSNLGAKFSPDAYLFPLTLGPVKL